MTLETALICILSLVALSLLITLYYVMLHQINEARALARALEERVRELEQANNFRMSYVSTREIENAMAGGAVAEQYALDLVDIIRNMKAHLRKAHTPNNKKATG